MVKHIVIWQLKDEYTIEQRHDYALNMKNGLESLKGQIDGIEEISVNIEMIDGCTGHVILQSVHKDEEAYINYRNHPKHVEVANTWVRPVTQNRLSADFMI